MQLKLPWSEPDNDRSASVVFVRHRRARRYILHVLQDGTLRVTLPRWGVKRDARAFIEASSEWIARQRELRRSAVSAPAPWGDGTRLLIDGREAVVRLTRTSSRAIHIVCDDNTIASLPQGDDVRAVVQTWLRDHARKELPVMLSALATTHGITVSRVSVRNQRSRWGACTPSGTITLNWRLIQTPPFVREYVLVHELMHRREMNHSRRFWRLVAAACPRHAEARKWLRKEGKALWSDCD